MNQVTYKANHLKDASFVRVYVGDFVKTYTGLYKVVGQVNFADGRTPLIDAVKLDGTLTPTRTLCSLPNINGECIAKSDWSDYIASSSHLTPYELPHNVVEDSE